MSGSVFVGRRMELERLGALYQKKAPALVVVNGRRRIGKSRLVLEFAKTAGQGRFWSFAGLAPQETVSAQDQKNHFARQVASVLNVPPMTFLDWSDAFEHLGHYIRPGDIILLDEISWMGSKDPTFVPKLKAWWDKQTMHMMLVFCGSVSTWIEENILKSTAFFGRVHLSLAVEPLSIPESAAFLRKTGIKLSDYDMYKLLSTVGGVPWYLEQFSPRLTAEENIKRLAFEKNGLLVVEFDRIFNDLFHGKGAVYKKILRSLQEGPKTLSEIRRDIGFASSGTLSQCMDHLTVAGFVAKQPLWSFKTTKPLKQSLYRVSDPYMRFYLKVISPYVAAISAGELDAAPLASIPGLDVHMGMQLETLLLQNRPVLLQHIGISPVDVVRSGPYRQSKNATQQGCQIDYLVQTKTNNLFICEFKFKKRELGSEIVSEVQEKVSRLKVPKGFARVPVLFHVGGVSDAVATHPDFYRIVDIADFLDASI